MDENGTEQPIEAKREDARKREDTLAGGADEGMTPEPNIAAPKLPEPPAQPQAESTSAPAPDGKRKKREFVSTGETIHRELTYRGVDWLLNSAIAVGFAFAVKRTRTGFDLWEKYAGGLGRFIFKPVYGINKYEAAVKAATTAEETAKATSALVDITKKFDSSVSAAKTFFSILVGGTLIIPVMTTLENHKNKKAIVKSLDKMIYGKEKVENDPKFAKAYKEIDEQPKKGFLTGMLARFTALIPMFMVMTNAKTGGWLEENYYPKLANGTKWLSRKVGIKPSASWVKEAHEVSPAELARDTEQMASGKKVYMNHWDLIHFMIGYDFGMTIFYSILHEISYNIFSRFFTGMKPPKPAQQEAPVTAPMPENQRIATMEPPKPVEKAGDRPQSQVGSVQRIAPVSTAKTNELGATA